MPETPLLLPLAGGLTPDEPDMQTAGLERLSGLVSLDGTLQPICGLVLHAQHGAGVSEPVTFARQYQGIGGINPLYAAQRTRLHYLDPATSTGTTLGTGFVADNWTFARFGNTILAASELNPVKASTNLAAFANAITSALTPRGRYITTIKTHVFMGYVDDGAAGARDPTKFWWSARNSASDWQPGSNRAGFANVRPVVGPITWVEGFEDFGVLFCDRAVYRIDYVGGDNVWALRQIGSEVDGLPAGLSRSVVAHGQNLYYISWAGPRRVIAGEEVQPLGRGKIRRHFMRPPYSGGAGLHRIDLLAESFDASELTRPIGAVDLGTSLIAWSFRSGASALGANSGAHSYLTYNVEEDSWALWLDSSSFHPHFICGQVAPVVATADTLGYPLAGLFLLLNDGTDVIIALASSTPTVAGVIRSRIWRPYGNLRTMLHGLRPHLRTTSWNVTAQTLTDVELTGLTIRVEGANDPRMISPVFDKTLTWAAANLDGNGYLRHANLPMEALCWRFTVNTPQLPSAPADTMQVYPEFDAIELLATPGTSIL